MKKATLIIWTFIRRLRALFTVNILIFKAGINFYFKHVYLPVQYMGNYVFKKTLIDEQNIVKEIELLRKIYCC